MKEIVLKFSVRDAAENDLLAKLKNDLQNSCMIHSSKSQEEGQEKWHIQCENLDPVIQAVITAMEGNRFDFRVLNPQLYPAAKVDLDNSQRTLMLCLQALLAKRPILELDSGYFCLFEMMKDHGSKIQTVLQQMEEARDISVVRHNPNDCVRKIKVPGPKRFGFFATSLDFVARDCIAQWDMKLELKDGSTQRHRFDIRTSSLDGDATVAKQILRDNVDLVHDDFVTELYKAESAQFN